MIKYIMTAAALKMFSLSPQTKRMYRYIGSTFDQRRRIQEGLNRYYVDRSKKLHRLCGSHHAIQNGDSILEVGTGWVHWDAMIMRLLYDVNITMFDVWDNRYFGLYKQYFRQFEEIIDRELDLDPKQSARVHTLLGASLKARSFEEVYDLLGLRYVLDPGGTLEQFADESFDLIFSCDVLEHINRAMLLAFLLDFHRVLKPGAYSIQQIDLTDHLYYYDPSVSPKNYLRYSDGVWRLCFENIQYLNRVQRSEWLELFQQAGLELMEEESTAVDIGTRRVDKEYENRYQPYNAIYNGHETSPGSLKVAQRYAHLSRQDLQCVGLLVMHRKPPG